MRAQRVQRNYINLFIKPCVNTKHVRPREWDLAKGNLQLSDLDQPNLCRFWLPHISNSRKRRSGAMKEEGQRRALYRKLFTINRGRHLKMLARATQIVELYYDDTYTDSLRKHAVIFTHKIWSRIYYDYNRVIYKHVCLRSDRIFTLQ